jgi:RNA-directed DNA polymerase
VVASEAFSRIDNYVFEQLWRMLRLRHQNKSKKWLFNKYRTASGRKHMLAVKAKSSKGLDKVYQVVRISSIGIKRHIKIKAALRANMGETRGRIKFRVEGEEGL